MLMAAGYEPPQGLFVHGYFTSGGQKMSKTLGNVIDPFEVIDRLGADALRFYLLREVQWGQDGDVTWEGLERRYSGELANDLGNLVSRSTAMLVRYRDGAVPDARNALEPVHESVAARIAQVDLTGALEEISRLVRTANRYVEEQQPWVLAKSDQADDVARLDEAPTRWSTPCARWRCCCIPTSPPPRRRSSTPSAIPALPGGSGPARPAARTARAPARAAVSADPPAIDTHAHLDGCDAPPEEVAEEAAAAGVRRILTIGREQAVEIAERRGRRLGSGRWHPHEADAARVEEPGRCSIIRGSVRWASADSTSSATTPPATSSGGCSRPRSSSPTTPGKPLVIHTRDADEETFPMLERARVGRPALLLLAARGCTRRPPAATCCSFAGNVTYPAAEALREAAAGCRPTAPGRDRQPLPGPGAAPRQPNPPANVVHTLRLLAERGAWRRLQLERQIERNAARSSACRRDRRGARAGAGGRGGACGLEPRRGGRPRPDGRRSPWRCRRRSPWAPSRPR